MCLANTVYRLKRPEIVFHLADSFRKALHILSPTHVDDIVTFEDTTRV